MDRDTLRLAVLIDADNTSAKYAAAIFEEMAKLGTANVRRIYGNWASDRLRGWRDVLASLAIVPQQQFDYTTGKNAADILLVIDAMDLMHTGDIDGYCLVSSDSDFTRLAQRLRESGAVVYGFGARKTPESFRNACSRFLYLENLGDEGTKSGTSAAARKQPASKAVPLIRKAMEESWEADEWVPLGVVGQRLNNLAPDFDSRSYGCANLAGVVEASGRFVIERPERGSVRIKRK